MPSAELAELEPAASPMSEMERLGGIFTQPSRTLTDVARRPTWILPLLIALGFGFLPFVLQPYRVERAARVRAMAEQASKFGEFDPKKLEEKILSRPETLFDKYRTLIIGMPVGVAGTLVLAGLLVLAFMIAGAQPTYKGALAAWCWAVLPSSVVSAVLAVLFLFMKDPADLHPLDPRANVISNPGILVGEKSQPVLYSLLSSIDVFSFWTIYMVGLGFAAASKGRITLRGSFTVIFIMWVLYVLLKTGMAGIFS